MAEDQWSAAGFKPVRAPAPAQRGPTRSEVNRAQLRGTEASIDSARASQALAGETLKTAPIARANAASDLTVAQATEKARIEKMLAEAETAKYGAQMAALAAKYPDASATQILAAARYAGMRQGDIEYEKALREGYQPSAMGNKLTHMLNKIPGIGDESANSIRDEKARKAALARRLFSAGMLRQETGAVGAFGPAGLDPAATDDRTVGVGLGPGGQPRHGLGDRGRAFEVQGQLTPADAVEVGVAVGKAGEEGRAIEVDDGQALGRGSVGGGANKCDAAGAGDDNLGGGGGFIAGVDGPSPDQQVLGLGRQRERGEGGGGQKRSKHGVTGLAEIGPRSCGDWRAKVKAGWSGGRPGLQNTVRSVRSVRSVREGVETPEIGVQIVRRVYPAVARDGDVKDRDQCLTVFCGACDQASE